MKHWTWAGLALLTLASQAGAQTALELITTTGISNTLSSSLTPRFPTGSNFRGDPSGARQLAPDLLGAQAARYTGFQLYVASGLARKLGGAHLAQLKTQYAVQGFDEVSRESVTVRGTPWSLSTLRNAQGRSVLLYSAESPSESRVFVATDALAGAASAPPAPTVARPSQGVSVAAVPPPAPVQPAAPTAVRTDGKVVLAAAPPVNAPAAATSGVPYVAAINAAYALSYLKLGPQTFQLKRTGNDKTLTLTLGEQNATLNGKAHMLNGAPYVQQGSLFFPVSVLQDLGCMVTPRGEGSVRVSCGEDVFTSALALR